MMKQCEKDPREEGSSGRSSCQEALPNKLIISTRIASKEFHGKKIERERLCRAMIKRLFSGREEVNDELVRYIHG
jgi:hypothetical protein